MEELLTPAQADAVVAYGAAAIGVGGALLLALGVLSRRRRRLAAVGALVTVAGALVYILWMVYNRIVGHFGLDSVAGLLVNLAVFAVVGLGFGIVAAAAWNWGATAPASDETSR